MWILINRAVFWTFDLKSRGQGAPCCALLYPPEFIGAGQTHIKFYQEENTIIAPLPSRQANTADIQGRLLAAAELQQQALLLRL